MDTELFELLNEKSMREDDFDQICMLRRDLGKLLKTICKFCGPNVLHFLNQRLAGLCGKDDVETMAQIEGCYFVIGELAKRISADDLPILGDAI